MTLETGTWQELDEIVGVELPSGAGWVTITEETVRRFGEVLEWDLDLPQAPPVVDGPPRIVAPAALSFVCGVKDYWEPGMLPRQLDAALHAPVPFLSLPAPGTHAIGTSYVQETLHPLYVGEPVSCVYEVLGYKRATTRIGSGAFIDVLASYRDRDGQDLVHATWTIFRYTPDDEALDGHPMRPARIVEPRPIHVSEINLDLQRMVMWAGVIRDFAPIHFDREYARSAGAPDAFVNTQFAHALYERALREAFGPRAELRRIGPFRMSDFARCNTVIRTMVAAPSGKSVAALGGLVVKLWQECNGRRTSSGEAHVVLRMGS